MYWGEHSPTRNSSTRAVPWRGSQHSVHFTVWQTIPEITTIWRRTSIFFLKSHPLWNCLIGVKTIYFQFLQFSSSFGGVTLIGKVQILFDIFFTKEQIFFMCSSFEGQVNTRNVNINYYVLLAPAIADINSYGCHFNQKHFEEHFFCHLFIKLFPVTESFVLHMIGIVIVIYSCLICKLPSYKFISKI